MIKIYTGYKGFVVFFLFAAGAFLFLSLFFWGISKVIQLFLPLLIVTSYLLIIVFSLGFLPATIVKDLRPLLAKYSLWMSYALGISTWIMSFFFVINVFGLLGIFCALLFKFLAPIALAGAMLKGSWHAAGHLAVWIGFTYGMRYYSQWVLSLNIRNQGQGRIIDVNVIEVKEH
jgi:hypothetical protein